MLGRCKDCGCILEKKICSSCHEELYISTFQAEHIDTVSNKFSKKAEAQRKLIKMIDDIERAEREILEMVNKDIVN